MKDIVRVEDEYYVRASSALADDRTRVLKYGDTFAVFNRYGDIEAFGPAQLVAARTGLTQAEAERRVSEVFTGARQVVDNARKATAHSLYWMFIALLIGAFCASYAATIGGRQHDHVVA